MSKKYVKWLILSAIITAFAMLPAVASAQGPSGNFVSGISCLNLSSTSTSATISFYDSNGTEVTSVPNQSFAPNSPWLLFTPSVSGLGSGFLGSAVVSSGQEAACSVNTQNAPGSGNRVGTSEGVSADNTGVKLYATQIVNALAGFNSYVSVQNAESTSTEVKATYFNSNGSEAASQTVTIPANSSHVFYQDDGRLPANFIGSASFESTNGTSRLAGAVALYNTNTAQLLSFNTFKEGATKVYLPRLAKNLSGLGYTSGWACQNLGSSAVNISMEITMLNQESNSTVSATISQNNVGAGQSWLGYLGNATAPAIDAINRGFGSAIVTANGPIACTANEDNRTTFNGQGSTYGGVPDGRQSTTMSFPQIVALGSNSFRGGFQIANTTGTATTCTYTFSNGDVLANQALAANGSNSIFAESVLTNNKSNFNGSVTVECGQPIVGIYNLSIIGEAASGDPFSTNNGINQ